MTDHQSQSSRKDRPSQPPTLPPLPFAAQGAQAGALGVGYGGDSRRDGPATPSTGRHSVGGYETGESSSSATRRRGNETYYGDTLEFLYDDGDRDVIPDSGAEHSHEWERRDQDGEGQADHEGEGDAEGEREQREHQLQHGETQASRDGRAQRRHRNKMGGGFLLRNPLSAGRSLGLRRFRGHQSPAADHSHARAANGGLDASPRTSSDFSDQGKRRSSGPSHSSLGEEPSFSTNINTGRRFSDSHGQQERLTMDADSSQIVLMALNLSESRRMAGRLNPLNPLNPHSPHNPARPAPPRLTPLPDISQASNLKQHLQQQRKTSRGSKALQMLEATPEGPQPALAADGSYPFALDPALELPYDYQFSPSTLARAQKAKEHLELLAQYRRLLDFLPPLKPGADRPTSGSPVSSPVGPSRRSSFGAQAPPPVMLGRQYNPLQYVRNRKVRARERQTIDGERQGFGDVECVKAWVTTVSSQMSLAGTSLLQGKISIPTFPVAEEIYNQDSAVALARMPSTARARRPRADWFVEPCDMIADAYWLEKDRHKNLIEDRHWRKIFPSSRVGLHPAMPGEEDDLVRRSLSVEQSDSALDEGDSDHPKSRPDNAHSSAKKRAKQKLHNIREGFHHRHAAPAQGHDVPRHKGGSASDISDSEDNETGMEGKKKARPSRKGTISSNSNDLLQKQMLEMLAKEAMENELADVPESPESRPVASADQKAPTSTSTSTSKPPRIRLGSRRTSLADQSDSDPNRSAAPGIPQLGSLLRRSQQHTNDASTTSVGNQSSSAYSPEARSSKPLVLDQAFPRSRSVSPARKPLDKIKKILRDKSSELFEPQPDHAEVEGGSKLQRTNSKRPKSDEAVVGLRSMFKGPRLDTVIRDSVSRLGDKLGDRIWKRDTPTEAADPDMTDDSDNDRNKQAKPLRTPGKKDDAKVRLRKPFFRHATNGHHHLTAGGRIDPFEASQMDGRAGIAPPYVPETCKPGSHASDVSEGEEEGESYPGRALKGAGGAARCLPCAPTMTKLRQNGGVLSRHWSPVDRSVPRQVTLSRREVARMRTLILSSGIKAREIHRRALELHKPFSPSNLSASTACVKQEPGGIPWSAILELAPKQPELLRKQVSIQQAYPLAAQTLNVAIQTWGHKWSISASRFVDHTSLELGRRAWDVRNLLKDELSEMTRKAADEADETSRDLALGQPLKIKRVVDTIEKILRKRGRRFRWVRRGMWLTVEWLLVGFMWYVWFMVMILRIFLGAGRGFLGCVRWLLWL